MTAARAPRFAVTELSGHLSPTVHSGLGGLSCHVVDRAYNYRVVATYRSEDKVPRGPISYRLVGSTSRGAAGARESAGEHCDRLNRWAEGAS